MCALLTSLGARNPSHTPSSLHSTAGMGLSTKAGLVRKKLFFHCELKLSLHYELKLFHCELSPALTQLTIAQQRPAELGWPLKQELFNPHSVTPLPLYKPVNYFNPYFPPILQVKPSGSVPNLSSSITSSPSAKPSSPLCLRGTPVPSVPAQLFTCAQIHCKCVN